MEEFEEGMRKLELHTSFFSASPSGGRCKYTGQSLRAVPIRVLTVGKKRSRGVQLLVDEYIEKLKNYCIVEDVQLRSNPRNARDPRAQVDDEDMAVVNLLKSDDWVYLSTFFFVGSSHILLLWLCSFTI